MISETIRCDGDCYRLSNLCIRRTELEEALQQLEAAGIRHRVREIERNTTDWPGQPDGSQTVHAVTIPTVKQRGQQQLAEGSQ